MGEMKVNIGDNIEEMFRRAAMRRFGYRKGVFSMAAEEAMSNWASSSIEEEKVEEPVKSIVGLMKNVKRGSVELQHEIGKILEVKYVNRHKHLS